MVQSVSEYRLTLNEQSFNFIMARTSYISMRWWCSPLCTRPTRFVGFYNANSLKQQSAGRQVALHYSDPSQPDFALAP